MATVEEVVRLEHIWDFLPVGVIIADGERVVRVCNNQAGRILQLPQPGTGKLLAELIANQEILNAAQHALRMRGTVTVALALAPGTFLEVRAQALDDAGVLVVLQDVSELRHLRTVRRDFVANVSHELRTPLASIRLLVDTLENGALEDASVASSFVHRIGVEADHLVQMVTELLELSRIESGQMNVPGREPVQIEELIGVALDRLAVVAQDKGISMGADIAVDLPLVSVDRSQVVQVLLNLLFNSIKFTPPSGSVRIRATLQEHMVAIEVADSGVGIAPEDLSRIFERFYKSDKARSRSGGGTGLGLPIARHIVEAHGGSIRAESTEGLGSTFTFTLPATQTTSASKTN